MNSSATSKIPLEQPASIRRLLPSLDGQGWMLPYYVVGDENQSLLHLFDKSLIANLQHRSPIVLYGDHGTGKTALSVALSILWSRTTGLRPLTFCTGSSFAEDHLAAIESDDLEAFYHRFRQCKALVVDDVDSIATKPVAQRELVQALDLLGQAQAPVLLTSTKLPASLDALLPALSSRLSGGLSLRIHQPASATQAVILDGLAQDIDPRLKRELLLACSESLGSTVPATKLKTLVMIAHQNRDADGSFNVELVRQLVMQMIDGDSLTIADIAKRVARTLRVKISDMRGSTRQAHIVRARGLAIVLGRRLTHTSLQQIGEYFGGRDHSTILHAHRKTESALLADAELAKALSDLQQELLQK